VNSSHEDSLFSWVLFNLRFPSSDSRIALSNVICNIFFSTLNDSILNDLILYQSLLWSCSFLDRFFQDVDLFVELSNNSFSDHSSCYNSPCWLLFLYSSLDDCSSDCSHSFISS
jgi:hypothetical protein